MLPPDRTKAGSEKQRIQAEAEAKQARISASKDRHRVEVGQRIQMLREAMGLSGVDFAGLIGVSPPGLWQIETGRTYPSLLTLAQVARLTAVSADSLLGVERPGKAKKRAQPLRERA